jgi:hypothetical protein
MVVLTAKDLLCKSIELVSITPEGSSYSEATLKNPTQFYRYKQIMAMLHALGIEGSFDNFLSADFMDARKEKEYEKLFKEITWSYYENKNARKFLKMGVGRLKASYLATFQYRLALHKTLHYWKGALICDPLYLYPITLAKSTNMGILNQIEILDNFLSAIIDPECKEIPIEMMKSKYDYPDVDIILLDLDYI